jgi:DNA-binding response OmpR family regulator
MTIDRLRQALCIELVDAGFKVVEAANGEEALEQFRASNPDVVITDLVMPECDGQQLLERLKSESDVPVLLFSSQGSVQSAVAALKSGANDFLSSSDVSVEEIVECTGRAYRC